jgi:acetylornithine deacetylase
LLARLQPLLAAQGLDGAGRGAPYVTDASHYSAVGAPTLVLGPGHLGQAHTKDEYVERTQLDLAQKVYRGLMSAR